MMNEKDLVVNTGIDFLERVCEEKGIDPSTLRVEKVEDTFSEDSLQVVETEFSISSSEIETNLPVRAVKPAVSGTPVVMETAVLSAQYAGASIGGSFKETMRALMRSDWYKKGSVKKTAVDQKRNEDTVAAESLVRQEDKAIMESLTARGDRDGDIDFKGLDLFNTDKIGKVTVSPHCLLPVREVADPSERTGAVVGVDWGLGDQAAMMRIERPNQFPVIRPYSLPGEHHLQEETEHKESNEERVCGFVDDLKYLACRHGLDLELTDILRLNDRKTKKTIGAVAMSLEADGFIYHVSGSLK